MQFKINTDEICTGFFARRREGTVAWCFHQVINEREQKTTHRMNAGKRMLQLLTEYNIVKLDEATGLHKMKRKTTAAIRDIRALPKVISVEIGHRAAIPSEWYEYLVDGSEFHNDKFETVPLIRNLMAVKACMEQVDA
jgi:hypothetical protein